jgi:hypothetical protein
MNPSRCNLRFYLGIWMEELRITRGTSAKICPGRDSILSPPEYKPETSLEPVCSGGISVEFLGVRQHTRTRQYSKLTGPNKIRNVGQEYTQQIKSIFQHCALIRQDCSHPTQIFPAEAHNGYLTR